MAAELKSILGAHHLVHNLMGRDLIAGVSVAAGGVIGQYGEIIVDSITNPTKVVGVASGEGTVIYEHKPEFENILRKVSMEILRRQTEG